MTFDLAMAGRAAITGLGPEFPNLDLFAFGGFIESQFNRGSGHIGGTNLDPGVSRNKKNSVNFYIITVFGV